MASALESNFAQISILTGVSSLFFGWISWKFDGDLVSKLFTAAASVITGVMSIHFGRYWWRMVQRRRRNNLKGK